MRSKTVSRSRFCVRVASNGFDRPLGENFIIDISSPVLFLLSLNVAISFQQFSA
jgi:hypothetical protein